MVGLASLVQHELNRDPFSGIMFVFRCKRADRIKLLLWDGTGLVLVTKRLETGPFRWPRFGDGVMSLTPGQASALIEEIGGAACRERGCQYGMMTVGAVPYKKQK